MFNRMFNCKNPHQGEEERVLVICSAGLLRSPTVASVMNSMGYNTRAAGIDSGHALIVVDDVLVHWADSFVVMDLDIADLLKAKFPYGLYNKPIYNYNIQDQFPRNDPELIDIATAKTKDRESYLVVPQEDSDTLENEDAV